MQFKQIYGREKEKQQLITAVNENRLSHALLFYGQEGNSALSLARALSQYINCSNQQDDDSCGTCPSCNKFSKLIHPDFHFSYPVYTKKSGSPALSSDFIKEWRAMLLENPNLNVNDWFRHIGGENKNANISAAECNNIIKKLQLKNYEANYKIMIIWQADLLKKEGNKLLKIIEEPPNNTLFILISNRIENILGTIISRTRQIKIPLLDDAGVQQYLMDTHQIDVQQALQIATLAEGNLNSAIALTQESEHNFSTLTVEWYQAAFKNDVVAANAIIDKIFTLGKQNQKHFVQYNLNFLRHTILSYGIGESFNRYNEREQKLLQFLSTNLELSQFEQLVEYLNELYYFIDRNVNIRIQLFYGFLQFAKLVKQRKMSVV